MVTQLLSRGWRSDLEELAFSASESILIAAPFIKESEAKWLCAILRPGIEVHTLARLDSAAVSNESLDIGALRRLATVSRKARLTALPRLHAKVFVADEKAAIVTSGNLTRSGLDANIEYGVALRESSIVRRVREDMLSFAQLGSKVSVRKLTQLARLEKELRGARASVENTASDEAKRRFDEAMNRATPTIAAIEVGGRSKNAIFGEAAQLVLADGRPRRVEEIHAGVQELLPTLCGDMNYVLRGKSFGKNWKHDVRNAVQYLKTAEARLTTMSQRRSGGSKVQGSRVRMLPSDYARMGWGQGKLAIDEDGNEVEGDDPTAVAWCIDGAIQAAYADSRAFDPGTMFDAIERILAERGELPAEPIGVDGHTRPAGRWNDEAGRSQGEAVAVSRTAERRMGLR